MRFGFGKDRKTVAVSGDAVVVPSGLTPAPVGPEGAEPVKTGYRSQRGRRAMMLLITLLILLLLIATLFLLNMIRPKGDVASPKEAGGVTWIRSIYGWGDTPEEQLLMPASVAIAGNGDIVVPNTGENAVRAIRFDNAGTYKTMFAGSKEGWLAYPTAVDVAPDGRMYFVQGPRNEVLVMDRAGTTTEKVIGIEKPTAIDVADDRMAVGSEAGWVILDLEGKVLVGPVGTNGQGDDQYDVVSGIALDEAKNVYVVDTYNNRISKFDPAGDKLWSVRSGSPANARKNEGGDHIASSDITGTAGLQTPSTAALDAAGRLLVIDPMDFSISAFDTKDGKFVSKWGTFGTTDGKFMYPTGIAYDATRDWVAIADTMNNRVQIVRIPGTGGAATSALARFLTGPIRACLLPLLLLLLAIIANVVYRNYKRRAEKNQIAATPA